ncbi:MAG: magnesium transporter [Rhodospirillales bacterium RIFCSPLOWO2_12_FULL_58_28]|nr:MAG: magnesium transporter [Rhodospirillales bacterium RIFCSPLOWO2_02_FULL_58_16]OHC77832.1 MAG: magnesium transporter [Rhodospirillales bacterium RIFCSPLOWO2_12_FULL_58_28]
MDPTRPDECYEAVPASDDSVHGLESEVVDAVVKALAAGEAALLRELFTPLHYADAADLLERLSADERSALIDAVRDDFNPEILSELDDAILDQVVDALGIKDAAAAVTELDSDDAVDVVEYLDEGTRRQVLRALPVDERAMIEESLSYPEGSAARLMRREFVSVPVHWTVGDTIDFIRRSADTDDDSLPDAFYNIFVINADRRPLGVIPLSRLLRSKRPVFASAIMDAKIKLIPATMDQEEVAFLFSRHDLVSAAVIDGGGRIVGDITIDDVVDVIHEEHEEDIMLMAGVSEDDFFDAAVDTTKARFTWLLVNLGTAVLAAAVIGMFEGTIDQIVALAILMPIVASMGGNAGTQTMTVTVRALAMKELTATNATRVIVKELLVGGINGVMFAVLTGLIAWLWFSSLAIGAVIAMAMVINMMTAALAGTTVPLLLKRSGIDPAVASSVILTTFTDVVGFLAFLGLATLFLL